MKKALRITARTMVMLLVGGGLLLTAGCISISAAAEPLHGHSDAIAEKSPEIEGNRPSAPVEELRKLEKDGNIHLSLSDCLKIALQQNYDIRLTREGQIGYAPIFGGGGFLYTTGRGVEFCNGTAIIDLHGS